MGVHIPPPPGAGAGAGAFTRILNEWLLLEIRLEGAQP